MAVSAFHPIVGFGWGSLSISANFQNALPKAVPSFVPETVQTFSDGLGNAAVLLSSVSFDTSWASFCVSSLLMVMAIASNPYT
jgi:hypothetical protein